MYVISCDVSGGEGLVAGLYGESAGPQTRARLRSLLRLGGRLLQCCQRAAAAAAATSTAAALTAAAAAAAVAAASAREVSVAAATPSTYRTSAGETRPPHPHPPPPHTHTHTLCACLTCPHISAQAPFVLEHASLTVHNKACHDHHVHTSHAEYLFLGLQRCCGGGCCGCCY